MAKELPYFKFEPGQWENGSIQICSFEEQGIFISVCSMYWQRLGDLPYKLAVQKACKGNATALDSLIEEQILKVIEGKLVIDFLNEQLSEFEALSERNSQNAKNRWNKVKKDATAMRPHNDRNAIREEKNREEEIRKDNINLKEVDFSEIKPFIDVVISKKGLIPEHGDAVWNEFFQREVDTEFENISHVRRLLGKFINSNDFSHLKKTGNGSAITTDGNYRCLELDDGYYWVWHERNGQPDYKQKRKATEDDFKRTQAVS